MIPKLRLSALLLAFAVAHAALGQGRPPTPQPAPIRPNVPGARPGAQPPAPGGERCGRVSWVWVVLWCVAVWNV